MRLLLLLALPALFASPAFTASSGVPTTAGGLGSATISGYEVSAIAYELGDGTIDTVSFRLSPTDARTVRVRLAPHLAWTTCTVADGFASCPVATDPATASALEVVAAG